jgi:hypothetical protein
MAFSGGGSKSGPKACPMQLEWVLNIERQDGKLPYPLRLILQLGGNEDVGRMEQRTSGMF